MRLGLVADQRHCWFKMSNANIASCARSLLTSLDKAINCDSWGQRLEAVEQYKRVHGLYHEGATNFCTDDSDEKEMTRIMNNIRRRAEMLESQTLSDSQKGQMGLDTIKADCETVKQIVDAYQKTLCRRKTSVVEHCGEKLLLPAPKHKKPGCSYLTIKIERIGLKDANVYVDPFITVTVKDRAGNDLTPVQNTPSSYHTQDKYIIFDNNVHIQKSLEDLPEDVAIFFEFNHYKEKKDKVSTRCFGFVERDEIKAGAAVIELYKKPVDFSRKKLYLFTEKPLYLHLFYIFQNAPNRS